MEQKCYWFEKKYFCPDYALIFSDITVQRNVPRFCTRPICGWNLFQPLGLRQISRAVSRLRQMDGLQEDHQVTLNRGWSRGMAPMKFWKKQGIRRIFLCWGLIFFRKNTLCDTEFLKIFWLKTSQNSLKSTSKVKKSCGRMPKPPLAKRFRLQRKRSAPLRGSDSRPTNVHLGSPPPPHANNFLRLWHKVWSPLSNSGFSGIWFSQIMICG